LGKLFAAGFSLVFFFLPSGRAEQQPQPEPCASPSEESALGELALRSLVAYALRDSAESVEQ
jgi:hypothetical protein